MILGIGTDLVDIRRIEGMLERHGERFIKRCFTAHERENSKDDPAFYAKRFAAKEACVKALGTGFIEGMSLRDIGARSDENGRPYLVLTGKAQEFLSSMVDQNQEARLHLSLSDEPPYAQAFVIIESVNI